MRTGWRVNQELEARNEALEKGLRDVVSKRSFLDQRHSILEEKLNTIESLSHSRNLASAKEEARLRAEARSAQTLFVEKQTLEERVVILTRAAEEANEAQEQGRDRLLAKEIELAAERAEVRSAHQRAQQEGAKHERAISLADRLRKRLERQLARTRWRHLGAAASLYAKRSRLLSGDTMLALQQAMLSAAKAKDSGRDKGTSATHIEAGGNVGPTWTLEKWLNELPVSELLAESIRKRLSGMDTVTLRDFFATLCDVIEPTSGAVKGNRPAAAMEAASTLLASMLSESGLLEDIAKALSEKSHSLGVDVRKHEMRKRAEQAQRAQRGKQTHGPGAPPPSHQPTNRGFRKFVDPGLALAAEMGIDTSNFTLYFGGIVDYNAGISSLIGEPARGDSIVAMRADHTAHPDRSTVFTTSNYNVRTTSEIEYAFVVDPSAMSLASFDIQEWPVEEGLAEEAAEGSSNAKIRMRRPRPLSDFEAERLRINDRLRARGSADFSNAMLIGGRLYTGPMFVKYNAILRGVKEDAPGFFKDKLRELCGANRYSTTIHIMNAALVILGQLSKATPVYRGVAGAKLPPSFHEPDIFGCKGGVEIGFMSTTDNKAVALDYAGADGGIVLAILQGITSRGASLEWLSQYPHERECTFPPLTVLEVVGQRTEESATVLELRPTISSGAYHDAVDQIQIDRQPSTAGAQLAWGLRSRITRPAPAQDAVVSDSTAVDDPGAGAAAPVATQTDSAPHRQTDTSGPWMPGHGVRSTLIQQALRYTEEESRMLAQFSHPQPLLPSMPVSYRATAPRELQAQRFGDGTVAQRLAPPRPSVAAPGATWRSAWPAR